jgi:hypothetical protein
LNTDTGEQTPFIIGTTGAYKGVPGGPTNIVAVVLNPAGEVVTMFPADAAYAASKGVILP